MIVGETVTATRKGALTGTRDGRGNLIPAASSPVTFVNVAVAPGTSSETDSVAGVDQIDEWTLYLPTGSTVLPTDVFTVRGVGGYNVIGDADQWTSPFSLEGKGVVVKVRRAG